MFSRHIKGQTGANRRYFYIISCHNEHEIGHPKLLPEGLKRGSREYKKAGRQGKGQEREALRADMEERTGEPEEGPKKEGESEHEEGPERESVLCRQGSRRQTSQERECADGRTRGKVGEKGRCASRRHGRADGESGKGVRRRANQRKGRRKREERGVCLTRTACVWGRQRAFGMSFAPWRRKSRNPAHKTKT